MLVLNVKAIRKIKGEFEFHCWNLGEFTENKTDHTF